MDSVLKHQTESRDFEHRLRALENEVKSQVAPAHSKETFCAMDKRLRRDAQTQIWTENKLLVST